MVHKCTTSYHSFICSLRNRNDRPHLRFILFIICLINGPDLNTKQTLRTGLDNLKVAFGLGWPAPIGLTLFALIGLTLFTEPRVWVGLYMPSLTQLVQNQCLNKLTLDPKQFWFNHSGQDLSWAPSLIAWKQNKYWMPKMTEILGLHSRPTCINGLDYKRWTHTW